MRILYLDLVGGLAGDMCVAALIDLGVPLDLLRERLRQAGLTGVDIETRRERRHQIEGARFLVTRRDGAMADGGLPLPADLAKANSHTAWEQIDAQLEQSALPARTVEIARRIFRVLAEAEGAIHGVPPERVQFHEVGAWDSIADIVCAAAGIEFLAVEKVWASTVPVGSGQIKTAHGVMPVPAPATLRLLQGFSISQGGPAYERTTPTGAALLAALASPAPEPLVYVPARTGIGIGKMDRPEIPNLVRAVLGDTATTNDAPKLDGVVYEHVELVAANLDDSNPEWIGYAMERLLAAGALDVALVPIQMKKNRPGTQVQVLCAPGLRNRMLEILLLESTTLGVRFQQWERVILPRESITVPTPWGPVAGKLASFGTQRRFTPEYEACRTLALAHGVPLMQVYGAAQRAYEDGHPRASPP